MHRTLVVLLALATAGCGSGSEKTAAQADSASAENQRINRIRAGMNAARTVEKQVDEANAEGVARIEAEARASGDSVPAP
jgi:hypothetical protein